MLSVERHRPLTSNVSFVVMNQGFPLHEKDTSTQERAFLKLGLHVQKGMNLKFGGTWVLSSKGGN